MHGEGSLRAQKETQSRALNTQAPCGRDSERAEVSPRRVRETKEHSKGLAGQGAGEMVRGVVQDPDSAPNSPLGGPVPEPFPGLPGAIHSLRCWVKLIKASCRLH